jgi:23S rRNA pseudouridine2457 synthase
VLCQFTDGDGRATLADHVDVPGVYPAGRLDRDSEGLVVLTDDGRVQDRLAHPRFVKQKGYWVQVERIPDEGAMDALRRGVSIKGGHTRPAEVRRIDAPPALWDRDPPVRFRKSVPDCWLELRITEGMNRQVRRMTAAVGHPTLRLVRFQVGPYSLGALAPGTWEDAQPPELPAVRRPRGPRRRR